MYVIVRGTGDELQQSFDDVILCNNSHQLLYTTTPSVHIYYLGNSITHLYTATPSVHIIWAIQSPIVYTTPSFFLYFTCCKDGVEDNGKNERLKTSVLHQNAAAEPEGSCAEPDL